MTVGTRLGPYELRALIGAGGMGEVYRAYDSRLQRTVAIKVLPPGAATPDRLRRFEQEAQAASALNHPNILTIHDVGREGDIAYVAMEWIEGQTLRSLLNGPRLPVRRIIEVAAQIADGLAKAHAAGIVHRDIKPENVMVSDDGFVKIVDFGLATLAAETPGVGACATGEATGTATALAGTVGYMSPEQAGGHPVDHRSDQFALGVMLYEMATRTRPFERATPAQSLVATIEAEPAPVEALNAHVPTQLSAVIKRCLEKVPADRYESTRDLTRDLKRSLDEPRAVGTVGAPADPARRRSAVLAAALVVLAIAMAGWYWRSAPSSMPAAELPLIAVRTFQNTSADGTQAYLATGLSEQIHGQLSRLSGLRLLNRGAVARYAGGDVPRMASELGVRGVVEGSVHIDGPRVHIQTRLIDAGGQRPLWSASYDRDRAEVMTVSGEVARQVVRTLGVAVTADERQSFDRRWTDNVAAYLLYVQWLSAPGDWVDRASHYASLDRLRKALALDPKFAVAQSNLAYDLVFMAQIYEDNDQLLSEGVANAEQALRHDVTSSEAHGAIAVAHTLRGRAAQARLSFQRGIALDPNDGSNMNNLSSLEVTFGRFVAGLEWARRAFDRSGRRGVDYYHVAAPLVVLRDDDLSLRWLLDGERRYPTHVRIQAELAHLEALTGPPVDAAARARRIVAREPDNPEGLMALAEMAYLSEAPDLEALTEPLMKDSAGAASFWLAETARVRYAYALRRRGETRRMKALLSEAQDQARRRVDGGDETPLWRVELGAIAALNRDDGTAMDWLSRAYDAGYRDYGLLERDPALATLRSTPRFAAMLDAMRRDVAAQRQTAREQGLLDIDSLLAVGQVTAGPR